jgi:hypothetical protein
MRNLLRDKIEDSNEVVEEFQNDTLDLIRLRQVVHILTQSQNYSAIRPHLPLFMKKYRHLRNLQFAGLVDSKPIPYKSFHSDADIYKYLQRYWDNKYRSTPVVEFWRDYRFLRQHRLTTDQT